MDRFMENGERRPKTGSLCRPNPPFLKGVRGIPPLKGVGVMLMLKIPAEQKTNPTKQNPKKETQQIGMASLTIPQVFLTGNSLLQPVIVYQE